MCQAPGFSTPLRISGSSNKGYFSSNCLQNKLYIKYIYMYIYLYIYGLCVCVYKHIPTFFKQRESDLSDTSLFTRLKQVIVDWIKKYIPSKDGLKLICLP